MQLKNANHNNQPDQYQEASDVHESQNWILYAGTSLLALVIIISNFLARQNHILQQKQIQQADTQDSKNWKVYKNVQYLFSINYPANYTYTEGQGTKDDHYLFRVRFSKIPKAYMENITLDIGGSLDLNKASEQEKIEIVGHIANSIDNETALKISGVEAKRLDYSVYLDNKPTPFSEIITNFDKYTFYLIGKRQFVDQIITTFKFQNPLYDLTAWKPYTDDTYTYSFKYPPDLTIDQGGNVIAVTSPIMLCATSVSGEKQPYSVSEINIRFVTGSGKSLADEWISNFNTSPDRADEKKYFAGKTFYCLYQGAEMPLGTTNCWTELGYKNTFHFQISQPVLISDCPEPLNKYPGVTDQILSTFEFLPDTSNWRIHSDKLGEYQFKYPPIYEKGNVPYYQGSTILYPLNQEKDMLSGQIIFTPNSYVINSGNIKGHVDNLINDSNDAVDYYNPQEKIIGNYHFYLIDGGCCENIGRHAFILDKGSAFEIKLIWLDSKQIPDTQTDLFDQILSTFKFTESAPAVNTNP